MIDCDATDHEEVMINNVQIYGTSYLYYMLLMYTPVEDVLV